MRSENIKKQQYYPKINEQQDNYKINIVRESPRNTYSRENDRNQLLYSRQGSTASRYDNEIYLPPIRLSSRQNEQNQVLSKKSRVGENKAQIYLSNCEYIAKNLRELKQKRQKGRYLIMQTQPSPKGQRQHERKLSSRLDIQTYPKNPYVSSQEKVLFKSIPKNTINRYSNNKYQFDPYYAKSERQEDSQLEVSVSPEDKWEQPKKFKKLSSSRLSERNNPKVPKQGNAQKQKEQQNAKVQKQLVSCLSELTHFLKNQNEKKSPQKKEDDSPKNASNRKRSIPSQFQFEKQDRKSKMQKRQETQRSQSLKYKAIVALKRLNQRSKQFMILASNRNQQMLTKQNRQIMKKRPSVKFVEDVEIISPRQRQNPERKDSQKTLRPILTIPVNLKASRTSNRSNSRLSTSNKKDGAAAQSQSQTPKSPKNDSLNSQLGNQLVSFLQKQQNQNLELSNCLKQMTSYLKIHNEQIAELRTSRAQSRSVRKSTSSKKQQLTQKEKEERLQQAVVQKLKKARLRGSMFKQKMEKFKNQHNLISTKKQPKSNQTHPTQIEDKQPENTDIKQPAVQQPKK